MNYNPVGWFEIPVTDVARAKKFYETLLGITFEKHVPDMGGYEMVWFPTDDAAKGIGGTLVKGPGYEPSTKGSIIYFTAPDIDAACARAETAGGKISLPVKAIGEYGFYALIQDSEGNTIALHTRKKE